MEKAVSGERGTNCSLKRRRNVELQTLIRTAMMSSNLWRSQSLKNLSGGQRSWASPGPGRKSVSQLVQQYQSCADLSTTGIEENGLKREPYTDDEPYADEAQSPWGGGKPDASVRRFQSNLLEDPSGFRGWSTLTRSRSMESLPRREPVGTSALRELFESKNALQQDFASSPGLHATPPAKRTPATPTATPARKPAATGHGRPTLHSGEVTPAKREATRQRLQATESERLERRKTIGSVPGSLVREEKGPRESRRRAPLDSRAASSGTAQDSTTSSLRTSLPSIRDRSVLYLSKAAAADTPGTATQQGSVVQEHIASSGKKIKQSKMADLTKQIKVTDANEEDDLPPPPPPPPPPRPHMDESVANRDPHLLPVPPPKETFSTFYQQRQKSELKRLFKHIHPDVKMNLDEAIDDEIVEAMHSDDAADSNYQGEVQSMRWIFENWTIDNIGDPHTTKKLLDEEHLQRGDVRGTSSMFEHGAWDSSQTSSAADRQGLVKGDVRTATWLFETQPMDCLGKSSTEEGELVEAVLKEPIVKGDVSGARLLFESRPLDALGRCCSVEDQSFLRLKSEFQEHKGDVKKTVKLFQAEPHCALRDSSGNIHEIKSICREEIQSSNFNTARWLFETQPLDVINKDATGIQIIRGISLEEAQKGGVDKKRWMFETQPLDAICEGAVEEQKFQGISVDLEGVADVGMKQKLYETQPLAAIKGETTSEKVEEKEVIVGGDVKSSLWLFETQPTETVKDCYEVGRLKRVTVSPDERGEVKGKRQTFENPNINKAKVDKENKVEDTEKGDVKSYKNLFETIPIDHISQSENEPTESLDITAGNVKGNKALFESTPLYAIKDSSGNIHEVTTVSREEIIKGNVQNYKWMFETRPLVKFEESTGNVEIIKGITRQEDTGGDVRLAKWLFETQSLDGIHLKFNKREQDTSIEQEEIQKGDVKTCKWLFETQPMDILYEKIEKQQETETIPKADVKSHTWLFETQPLDNIKDGDAQSLKLSKTLPNELASDEVVNVKTVKHLFETETLDRITSQPDSETDVRYVSQINVQSGDVSRVKEIFESQSLDAIGCEMMKANKEEQDISIQAGSVHKFTWLFENQPISTINDKEGDITMRTVTDMESGDVGSKKFIFETFSLDKIEDQDQLLRHQSVSVEKPVSGVDVKSSTMLFESQPLYAIRDKEGQFHEVTTVKKEEVLSGDVRGARWMFETKPLDAIQEDKEVYVIRAVTQEDVLKGDVKSARWRFETQPLDSLTSREVPSVKVVEDITGSNNVQLNKKLFESESEAAQRKYVRMVSVTDVQQGDVRTSTWLFETQAIDSLKGEPQEQSEMQTVLREEVQKGDVKRCTWLFESKPLDKIMDLDPSNANPVEQEDIPTADVKSTTWMFETTPLDKITVESVTEALCRLSQLSLIHSSGIVIQAHDVGNVIMAKYQLLPVEGPKVQKEEAVEGNIRNIMLQLLYRPNLKPRVAVLQEDEQGNVQASVLEIPLHQQSAIDVDEQKQKIERVVQIIESVLVQSSKSTQAGLVMQESEDGQPEMAVYSFRCQTGLKAESVDIQRGDVKSAIGNLLATAHSSRVTSSCRLEDNEKGNVDLYRSCIEKGDLQYLKNLQAEPLEEDLYSVPKEQIEILQGDVKEAKRHLKEQKDLVERTVLDIVSGDVKTTKKVFLSSPTGANVDYFVPKDDIIPGDVTIAKRQLTDAVKQPLLMQKEEIVSGDIKATLESLERAKQQSIHMERDVITPGTIYDLDVSVQELEDEDRPNYKEKIVSGDIKAAKQSLEEAKSRSLRVDREVLVPGKIYDLNATSSQEGISPVKTSASTTSNPQVTTTFRKVSASEIYQGTHDKCEAFRQSEVERMSDLNTSGVETNSKGASVSYIPYIMSESEAKNQEHETAEEVMKGDVKAAIQSLYSASSEQRTTDKEEIVRGDMQAALQSLQKSSVNVSQGDYKAAMIYRKAGQSYSEGRKKKDSGTVCKQNVMSMPPSDTELSPSVSVTYREHRPTAAMNSAPVISSSPAESSRASIPSPLINEGPPPPLPPKTCEQLKELKPALPPKPQWSTMSSTEPNDYNSDTHYIPAIPPKMKMGKSTPPPLPQGTALIKNEDFKDSHHMHATNETEGQQLSNKTEDRIARKTKQCTENWKQETTIETLSENTTAESTVEMQKNVVQKIDAAEEIRLCMQTYSTDSEAKNELNMGFKVALQNFGGRKKGTVDETATLQKKVKSKASNPQGTLLTGNVSSLPVSPEPEKDEQSNTGVILREKRGRRETENERRQRLSVHRDEIMKGNVKATMDIFENLRKREELKTLLSQVQVMEGDRSEADVKYLRTFYENVPTWVVGQSKVQRHSNSTCEKNVDAETESLRDETDSVSSVEAAFEDLEKASIDIICLKEQTLVKLLEIEEAIKKALFSVSNLKSEADIMGLSGLFNESLKTEQCSQNTNNIRKISIGTSKAKTDQSKSEQQVAQGKTKVQGEVPLKKLEVLRPNPPSSPAFISIHSAARKTTGTPKSPPPPPPQSTNNAESRTPSSNGYHNPNGDRNQPSETKTANHFYSPKNPKRKVSILEVQTMPEPEPVAGIIGTKTVSETYEERDCFGNSFVSSTTSTVVTKQSETKASSSCEVLTSPNKSVQVIASPLMHRSDRTFAERKQSHVKDSSKVFVTFGHTKTGKH
ncbi:xin actin-binding repeat-containing protein 1 isoform X2 [Clupea harengus]|uniref:Xin actin-binding repeat-containing protein 1 isoform X2 n=1 Tax=Clupea harengus TaxID=7950 RepID=A0A6P8ER94_CLUHA|nr:xin actin-binding repeat-containing protein 1 isoform X2 [Clupea harengus]